MSGVRGSWTLALKALLRVAVLCCLPVAGIGPCAGKGAAACHCRDRLWPSRAELSWPQRPPHLQGQVRERRSRRRIQRADRPDAPRRGRGPAGLPVGGACRSRWSRRALRPPHRAQHQSHGSGRKALHRPDADDLAGPAASSARGGVADLARARQGSRAHRRAEAQGRRGQALNPVAALRVGRNPTFLRVEFNWNVDTKAQFAVKGQAATVDFDWPVPIDIYALKADLPEELKSIVNSVSADGSRISFRTAEGIVPRFYTSSPRQYVVDIDISREDGLAAAIEASEQAKAAKRRRSKPSAKPLPMRPLRPKPKRPVLPTSRLP